MTRRRVCVAITARPSYSRVKSALEAIRAHKDLELQLVVCASALLDRYGNVSTVIERDGFEIAEKLYTVFEGDHPQAMAKTTGHGMAELATCFARLKPDVVVTIADRYETLATAAAASYMNIPLVHIQGGEVTGSIDDKVRNAVTQLADLHFVSTDGAARRVSAMLHPRGIEPGPSSLGQCDTSWVPAVGKGVYVTGCPSIDLAARLATHGKWSAPEGGTGSMPRLDQPFLVVLQHPVTDEHGQAYEQAMATLEAVGDVDMPAFWFWPNVDSGSDGTSKAMREYRENLGDMDRNHYYRSVEPFDFLALASRAACIVGNSSFGIREASFLGIPAVNIGSRQKGRERAGNVADVPHDRKAIKEHILARAGHRYSPSSLYGDGRAGQRIAGLLAELDLKGAK